MSREKILAKETFLGIELGSTRIKAVLIDSDHKPLASGSFSWENRLENGIWTYKLEDAVAGLQACYADLCRDIDEKYGLSLNRVGAIGISGMMHGYLAFDESGRLLAPFRTWRNTITAQAAEELSALFDYNIPQRWSIAHLYQSILKGEEHLEQIAFLSTLAGYIHFLLTGEKVLGICEASGMFPVDSSSKQYIKRNLEDFDELAKTKGFNKKIADLLPTPLLAGQAAGMLTEQGARLLDPSGILEPGIPLCPPEGDAGTGMVATNSVAAGTGNISAGTSIFAMIVLEKALSKAYPEIDVVTTPAGDTVAMVHSNNGSGDLDGWVGLLGEFAKINGLSVDTGSLYESLFKESLKGSPDCGGLLSCNYLSGEHLTEFSQGRPLFARSPQSDFSLANFMRTQIYGLFATLRIGMDILIDREGISLSSLTGHGGVFKTKAVAQKFLAAALDSPVTVMENAGEGGPWGVAILAAFMLQKSDGENLAQYLEKHVFDKSKKSTISPSPEDVEGFNKYLNNYKNLLQVEKAAVDHLGNI